MYGEMYLEFLCTVYTVYEKTEPLELLQ